MSFSARPYQHRRRRHSLLRHALVPLLFALASLLPAAATLSAQTTRRVPADFPTIQSAINASATGDTVLVSPGTYFEDLSITNTEITLTSSGGPSVTFLDGASTHALLTIVQTPTRATTVSGFTFQHGSPAGSPLNFPTAAAITTDLASATLTGNIFAHNLGPAILGRNSSLLILNNTISTAPAGSSCNSFPGLTSAPVGVALVADASSPTYPLGSALVGNTIFGDGTPCSGNAITLSDIGDPILVWNNTLRNNSTALTTSHTVTVDNLTLFQNLIYDNATGALQLANSPAEPAPGPPSIHILNNTIVNNLTSQPAGTYIADIVLQDTFGRAELVNNILTGTTSRPVLLCRLATSSDPTPIPVILDHNDLFNTSAGPVLAGPCTAALSPDPLFQLAQNGNLSVDPQLTGSTDLHPLPSSPVLDAGNNSALRLILPPAAPDPSLTPLLSSDIAGSPRIADSTSRGTPLVDLGAYERPGSATALIPTALDLVPASFAHGNGLNTVTATVRSADGATLEGSITFFLHTTFTETAALTINNNATFLFSDGAPGFSSVIATFTPYLHSYAPSTSVVRYINGSSATATTQTTLTLSASPSTQTLNQPITLSAHLGSTTTTNGATTPGPIPPGALALSQDGVFLTTLQPDSSGLATYTIPQPGLGPHTWTVTYAGTSTYPSASASTSATVLAPATTAVTATISPSPAPEASPITLAATVTATSGSTTPTGSLTFTDGATPLGTLPLSAGSATLTTSSLSLGTHTITFTYQPDPGFSPSSNTRSVTIGGIPTTTTLSASPNPAAPNTPVQLTTSTFTQQSPTQIPNGSISLSDGATVLFSGPISASTPAVVTSQIFSTAGTHHLSATFTPATATWLTSTTTLDLLVTTAPTITATLTPSSSSLPVDQGLTLTTTYSPRSSIPAGSTLALFDSATILASSTFAAGTTDTSTTTVFPGNTFSSGGHRFSATITSPSGILLATTNVASVQIVGPATSLVLTAAPSPTALIATPVTLSALVTSSFLPTGATLSGTVVFRDGTAVLGLAPLSAAGTATLTTSALALGPHTLSATWPGTPLLPGATSPTLSETITPNPSATTLSINPSATTAFSPVTLAAHVTGLPGAGTVTFFSGPVQLAQAALDASGNAITLLTLPAGNYTVTAVFSGSTTTAASTSAPVSLTVAPVAGTLLLTGTASALTLGSSLGLTATYSLPSPLPSLHPVGTVTFTDGATPLATVPLAANGSATLTNTPTTLGLHTLTATYSGDLNDIPVSATYTFTVLAVPAPTSDFAVSVAAPAMSIQTTHHSSTTVTITTTGPFADTVQLSCTDLPAIASCTFSPATLHVGSTTVATGSTFTYTATLALDTDFILNWAHTSPPASPRSPHSPLARGLPLLAILLPAPLLLLTRRGRRLPPLLTAILCCGLALSLSACGNKQPGHTDPGAYTIHIVAHANGNNLDRAATLQLTVTP